MGTVNSDTVMQGLADIIDEALAAAYRPSTPFVMAAIVRDENDERGLVFATNAPDEDSLLKMLRASVLNLERSDPKDLEVQ